MIEGTIGDIKLKKEMTKEEVNGLIGEWLTLEDEVYLAANYKHNWKCKCGNIFKRRWDNIKGLNTTDCGCIKYNQQEQRYRYEVEKTGDYEYIRSYRKGDILPNGKVVKGSPYIQVKHKYCGSIYEVNISDFIYKHQRCGKCCGLYENSFAYYIEKILGEPLEKYWDFDKNIVNPYHIWKNSHTKVWIKCTEKDYHGSYETLCYIFKSEGRCSYCNPSGKDPKIHPLDSFGYKHFDKVQSWHPDNKISPFRVAPNSRKKFKFICPECDHEWEASLTHISKGTWCPQCNSSKGEKEITKWLRLNNIEFIPQKKFEGLVGTRGGNLSYDFYLPKYNLLIEYQGEYHDGSATNQTKEQLKTQQEHDKRKREYAKNHNIDLLEIWYWDFDSIEEILHKQIKYKINLDNIA